MKNPEKFWDKWAVKWDDESQKYNELNIKIIDYIKKYLNADDAVLDFGCGTGNAAIEIADVVKQVHGIDISSKMIEAAAGKAAEKNVHNVSFRKTTLFEAQYKNESFDMILALDVLLHAGDTQKIIKKFYDLLKPGGIMISATACMGEKRRLFNIIINAFVFLAVKVNIYPDFHFFKIPELEVAIANENFGIIQAEILTHYPATEYFIAAKKIQ